MPEDPSSESAPVKRLTPAKIGKPLSAMVTLLDGQILEINIERKAKGEKILDEVCRKLDLLEKDYFGLNYLDKTGRKTWLDLEKRVGKILKGDTWKLDFEVKFYPKDPSQLRGDFTRYLLCLQVRNDILSGKLPCSFVTHAMLGSYLVQSQLGDYSAEEYPDSSYLSGFKFSPEPTPGLEEKVMALHKGHKGQTPAEAEQHYLENAKKLSMYGVDMHPAKDSEGVDIQLGVCSTGILVHQDMLRINRFAWPKILKISYRRNNFYIKIRPGEFEQYEQTVGFKLENNRTAKNLWKVCVDQHTFFRLMSADAVKRPGLFPRLGSLYRPSGKTQVEVMGTTNPRNNENFERSHSFRPSRSLDVLGPQPPSGNLDDDRKRHTMSHAPARPGTIGSPPRNEKRPAGGVAVLPMEVISKKRTDKDKESGTNGLSSKEKAEEEKENRENRIDDSTPLKEDTIDKKKPSEKSHSSLIGIFGSTREKKTKEKDDNKEQKGKKNKKERIAVAETVTGEFVTNERKNDDRKNDDRKNDDRKNDDRKNDDRKTDEQEKKKKGDKLSVFKKNKNKDDSKLDTTKTPEKDRSLNEKESPYTKVYEYTAEEETSRPRTVSGFSYETDKVSPSKSDLEKSPNSSSRTEKATAFNYAPGEIGEIKNISDVSGGSVGDKSSGGGTGKKNIFGGFFGSNKKKEENLKSKEDLNKDSLSKENSKSKKDSSKEDSKSKKESLSKEDSLKSKKESPSKDDSIKSKKESPSKDDSIKSKKDSQSKEDSKSKKDESLKKDKSSKKDESLSKSVKKDESKKEDSKKDKSKKDEKKDKSSKKEDSTKKDKKSSKSKDSSKISETKELSPSEDFIKSESEESKIGPKIVKTTTKSQIVNQGGTLTQNVEESVEDVNTGEVTHSTLVNTAEGLDNVSSPFITATAVTTRTATTLEDLGTNAKTSQVEEKTVARSTTTSGSRQEQRVVTQEVRATTVVNEPQIKKSGSTSSLSSDDSGTPIDGDGRSYYPEKPQGPIVETETVVYSPIGEGDENETGEGGTPLIRTVSQRLDDGTFALPGAVVTSQTITSKTRTVETLTYKTEKDGVVETRVEQKITIQSDGDPIDHEKALNEAIQEATAMNPDMRVEKIEIQQEAVP